MPLLALLVLTCSARAQEMEDFTPNLRAASDATLEVYASPEMAGRQAAYAWTLYQALRTHGFTDKQAIEIVAGWGPPVTNTDVGAMIGLVLSEADDPLPFMPDSPSSHTPCPEDGSRDEGFAEGTRVVLIAIHADDAYKGSTWEGRLPMAGVVQGDLHNNGGCWFGGGFLGDDGTDFYFYKAAFKAEAVPL